MATEVTGMTSLLQIATRKTVSRMPPSMESAFRAGDQIQRQVIELFTGALGPGWLEPRSSLQATIDVLQQSAELLSLLMPGHEGACDWREMQNKVVAYKLFEHADKRLAIRHSAPP